LFSPIGYGKGLNIPKETLDSTNGIWKFRDQHLLWCNGGYGHFVYLTPTSAKGIPSFLDLFAPKLDETKDFCCQIGNAWYYMGTYECINTGKVDYDTLATTDFFFKGKSMQYCAAYECFFMECVGFNSDFDSMTVPQHGTKRSYEEGGYIGQKRARG